MTDVQLNGVFVELGPEFQLEGTIKNPLFSESGFAEGFSYVLSIPLTVNNKANADGKKGECVIWVGGTVLFSGYFSYKDKDEDSIQLFFISRELKFVQDLKEKKLAELTWAQYTVYTSGTDIVKNTAWQAIYNQVMLVEPATEGTFKLPMISTKGAQQLTSVFSTERNIDYNNIWEEHYNMVNVYTKTVGSLLGNFPTPTNTGEKNWANSVAPCPRIEYILEEVISQFGFILSENELQEVAEFMQMWTFNNYVLDREVVPITNFVNTFQGTIDLKNHVPDADCYSIFELLNEFFDAFFVIVNNKVEIRLAKTALAKPVLNYSKYLVDFNGNEENEQTNYIFKYPVPTTGKEFRRFTIVNSAAFPLPGSKYLLDDKIVDNGQDQNTDVPLKNFPLTSMYYQLPGFLQSWPYYQDYLNNLWDPENWMDSFVLKPYLLSNEFVVSDAYPDGDGKIATNFQVGLYRGLYNTAETDLFVTVLNNIASYPYSYNLTTTPFRLSWTIPFNWPIVGQNTLYQTGDYNLFDEYKAKKVAMKSENGLRERSYALPIHLFKEMISFENSRHIIQQGNESFVGVVKEVKFVINSMGLAEVKPVYI